MQALPLDAPAASALHLRLLLLLLLLWAELQHSAGSLGHSQPHTVAAEYQLQQLQLRLQQQQQLARLQPVHHLLLPHLHSQHCWVQSS
jgi:hypothetical protein